MLRFAIILFSTVIFGVNSFDLTYDNKVAFTVVLGLECINNCVNGSCLVDETDFRHNCENTETDALVYRTIHDKVCLSRYFETDEYTGKCFINQDRDWDYCDPSKKVEWIRDQVFTDENGPCRGVCRSESKGRPRCLHWWYSQTDYCDPQWGFNYVQARTITGKPCRGTCRNHIAKNKGYTWCAYGDREEEACALPGTPRQRDWSDKVEEILTIKEPICVRVKDFDSNKAKCSPDKVDAMIGVFEKYVKDLENDTRLDTVFYHNSLHSTYSFTSKRSLMPMVVKAIIRPRHLYYGDKNEANSIPSEIRDVLGRTGRKSDDEIGYFVSYFLGGPQDKVNIYNRKFNINYNENRKIIDFLEKNRHEEDAKVDLIAVALYRNEEMRPSGILKRIKFYHTNSLQDFYYEYLPNDYDDVTVLPSAIGRLALLPPVNFNQGLKDGDCYVSGVVDRDTRRSTAKRMQYDVSFTEENKL